MKPLCNVSLLDCVVPVPGSLVYHGSKPLMWKESMGGQRKQRLRRTERVDRELESDFVAHLEKRRKRK